MVKALTFYGIPRECRNDYLQGVLSPVGACFAVFVKFHQREAQSLPIATMSPVVKTALAEYKRALAAGGHHIGGRLNNPQTYEITLQQQGNEFKEFSGYLKVGADLS